MPFAEVRGQRLYYRDDGDASSDETVVFSHGFMMDHEMFAPQVAALSGRSRCISWDMRRHGQTGSDGKPFSVADVADDLIALLDHLEISSAVLVGFSFGGWVTTRVALRRPDLVKAIAILDSYEEMESEETIEGYKQFRSMIAEQGFDDVVTETMSGFLFHPDYDNAYWVAKWRARSPLEWHDPYEAMFTRDDVNDQLASITCPSIVLHGEGNIANPPAVAEQLGANLGNCLEVVIVPGAGHSSNLEQPDFVNERLLHLLETCN